MSDEDEPDINTLIDDEDEVLDGEPGHDRRALPGETIDRIDVEGGWVKNYDKLMSKDELEESRSRRQQFESKFVEFPYSLWTEMTTRDEERVHLDSIVKDEIGSESYYHTWSIRAENEKPALSQFPSKLVKQAMMMWSFENEKVFDPFAGHMTRPILTNYFGRDYWGCDVSHEYVARTKNKIMERTQGGLLDDEVLEDSDQTVEVDLDDQWLRLERRDTRNVDQDEDEYRKRIPSEWADFIFTSPPYWDLEDYGEEDDQLGKDNDDFMSFIEDMEQVMEQCYRILKDKRYAAFVINDFRKNCMETGLTDFHRYIIEAGEKAGFNLHDIALYPTGQSSGIFTMQLTHMEVTAKNHEYIVVFRKNETGETWEPRGIHLDCYSRELMIDEYGEEYLRKWMNYREKLGLDNSRWEPKP